MSREIILYTGMLPKSCDNCYLIRRIELYTGKRCKNVCPISGLGRVIGRRSIACPFVTAKIEDETDGEL